MLKDIADQSLVENLGLGRAAAVSKFISLCRVTKENKDEM